MLGRGLIRASRGHGKTRVVFSLSAVRISVTLYSRAASKDLRTKDHSLAGAPIELWIPLLVETFEFCTIFRVIDREELAKRTKRELPFTMCVCLRGYVPTFYYSYAYISIKTQNMHFLNTILINNFYYFYNIKLCL